MTTEIYHAASTAWQRQDRALTLALCNGLSGLVFGIRKYWRLSVAAGLFAIGLDCATAVGQSVPSYDSASNQVSLPSILVNGVSSPAVVVTVGGLVGVGGGNPQGTVSTYDSTLNQATLPSVVVDGLDTYTNVVFTPGQVIGSGTPELVPTERSVGFQLRGFNLSAFSVDSWDVAADNEAALQFIKTEGGNAVVLDWMVEFADDGTMSSNGGSTHPPWADIVSVVARAKALGLYVVLKPHVISTQCCGQNRNSTNTNIETFLPATFFPAWRSYLLNMISLLPMQSVDAISIGTELDILDWQFRSEWASTIQAVRGVYSGAVTYDAMFSQYSGAKDVGDVIFWDLVDFISCSFYVRLSQDDTLSAPSLAALMRNTPGVDIADPIAYLEQIASQYGKQIFTLEGGYQSANGALWGVNDYYGAAATENQDLQSRGLDAYLFTLNFNQGNWLKGVSLWDIQPRHWRSHTWVDPNYRNGWGMYNKAAADTVMKWYSIP